MWSKLIGDLGVTFDSLSLCLVIFGGLSTVSLRFIGDLCLEVGSFLKERSGRHLQYSTEQSQSNKRYENMKQTNKICSNGPLPQLSR